MRKSTVVLRIYRRPVETEMGSGHAYRLRMFNCGNMDKDRLAHIVKHHFEGEGDEEYVDWVLWHATGLGDEDEFFAELERKPTPKQEAIKGHLLEMLAGGTPTRRDVMDSGLDFSDGYDEGYRQAQRDWGLPVREADETNEADIT